MKSRFTCNTNPVLSSKIFSLYKVKFSNVKILIPTTYNKIYNSNNLLGKSFLCSWSHLQVFAGIYHVSSSRVALGGANTWQQGVGTLNKYREVLCSWDGHVHGYSEEREVGLTWDNQKGLWTEATTSWVYIIMISNDIFIIVKAYHQGIYKLGKNFKLIVIQLLICRTS